MLEKQLGFHEVSAPARGAISSWVELAGLGQCLEPPGGCPRGLEQDLVKLAGQLFLQISQVP